MPTGEAQEQGLTSNCQLPTATCHTPKFFAPQSPGHSAKSTNPSIMSTRQQSGASNECALVMAQLDTLQSVAAGIGGLFISRVKELIAQLSSQDRTAATGHAKSEATPPRPKPSSSSAAAIMTNLLDESDTESESDDAIPGPNRKRAAATQLDPPPAKRSSPGGQLDAKGNLKIVGVGDTIPAEMWKNWKAWGRMDPKELLAPGKQQVLKEKAKKKAKKNQGKLPRPMQKLTPELCGVIIRLSRVGLPQRGIAALLDVAQPTISRFLTSFKSFLRQE